MKRKDKRMNGLEKGGPDREKMARWEAEPKKFEVLPPPEVTENHTEQKLKEQNGQSHIYKISNEKGQLIYKRSSWYDKPTPEPDPEKDIPVSDRQQFFTYDEQSRVTEKFGQTLSTKEGDPKHENQWRINHEYGEGGQHAQTGIIETGPDAGHSWQTTIETVKDFGNGRRIVKETNTILEQGQNPNKPEKGTGFEKLKYFEGGKWLGETTTNLKTGETSEFLAPDVEKLPDWK